MGNIAAYVRTSKSDKDGSGQQHAIAKAQRSGEIPPERWYVDIGHSGAKAQRPDLDRLRQDIMTGEVKVVFVFGLDRIARNLRNLLELWAFFDEHEVTVISLREGIDTTKAVGRLVLQILGAVAEFERELAKERAEATIASKREKGIRLGRKPSERRNAVAAAVLAMRAEGATYEAIAAAQNVPMTMVHRIVKKNGVKNA